MVICIAVGEWDCFTNCILQWQERRDLVAPVFVIFLGLVWFAVPISLVFEKLAAEEYFEYNRLKSVVYRKHLPPHGSFHNVQITPPPCGYGIKSNAVLIDINMEMT